VDGDGFGQMLTYLRKHPNAIGVGSKKETSCIGTTTVISAKCTADEITALLVRADAQQVARVIGTERQLACGSRCLSGVKRPFLNYSTNRTDL
jgi:hypothetical protein